jgi:hypothetical protein
MLKISNLNVYVINQNLSDKNKEWQIIQEEFKDIYKGSNENGKSKTDNTMTKGQNDK